MLTPREVLSNKLWNLYHKGAWAEFDADDEKAVEQWERMAQEQIDGILDKYEPK